MGAILSPTRSPLKLISKLVLVPMQTKLSYTDVGALFQMCQAFVFFSVLLYSSSQLLQQLEPEWVWLWEWAEPQSKCWCFVDFKLCFTSVLLSRPKNLLIQASDVCENNTWLQTQALLWICYLPTLLEKKTSSTQVHFRHVSILNTQPCSRYVKK